MSGKRNKVRKKIYQSRWASLVAQPEKNPLAMQEMEDVGSILGSGKSLEKEMATHSGIAWIIPWTEDDIRLQAKKSWT